MAAENNDNNNENIKNILKIIGVITVVIVVLILLRVYRILSEKTLFEFSNLVLIGSSISLFSYLLYKINTDKLFSENKKKTDAPIPDIQFTINELEKKKNDSTSKIQKACYYVLIALLFTVNVIFKLLYFIFCQLKDVFISISSMDMKTLKEKVKKMLSDSTSKYLVYSVIIIIICLIIIFAHINPTVPEIFMFHSNETYQEGPYNLNESKALTVDMNNTVKPEYIDEFSLSCWFFLGNTAVYNKQRIISFDDKVTVYVSNHNKLLLEINGSLQLENDIEIETPLQKWNQLIINYKQGYIDIFVNNKLVQNQVGFRTDLEYEKSESPRVQFGSKNTFGGIKDIRFKKESLTRLAVSLDYFKYRLLHEGHIAFDDFVFA